MSEDTYWYNKKPLPWGDPGREFRERERKKLSDAVRLINESGQFEGKNDEEIEDILKTYGLLLKGHAMRINGILYCNSGRGDKSSMGYVNDRGANDVLEASLVLDKALELIK